MKQGKQFPLSDINIAVNYSREMEQKQTIWNKNRPLFLGTYTAARGVLSNSLLLNMKIWTLFFVLIKKDKHTDIQANIRIPFRLRISRGFDII